MVEKGKKKILGGVADGRIEDFAGRSEDRSQRNSEQVGKGDGEEYSHAESTGR